MGQGTQLVDDKGQRRKKPGKYSGHSARTALTAIFRRQQWCLVELRTKSKEY